MEFNCRLPTGGVYISSGASCEAKVAQKNTGIMERLSACSLVIDFIVGKQKRERQMTLYRVVIAASMKSIKMAQAKERGCT